jgi:hypothetical protein
MNAGKVLPFAKGLDLKKAKDCAIYLNKVKLVPSGIRVIDAVKSITFNDGSAIDLRGEMDDEALVKAANEIFFYLKQNNIKTEIA